MNVTYNYYTIIHVTVQALLSEKRYMYNYICTCALVAQLVEHFV